jgi:exosortase
MDGPVPNRAGSARGGNRRLGMIRIRAMTLVANAVAKTRFSWLPVAWFGGLLAVCYAPVIWGLLRKWNNDPDMGHGFFVPAIAAYIIWQKRAELTELRPSPNWWGLLLVIYAAFQLVVATLGAELFLARTALVLSIIGAVLFLGGVQFIRKLAFPLALLFFMVPLPEIIYNRITFPLQLLASRVADHALTLLQVPVLREGNILELPQQRLSVVEACSGIRSLLSLTFLALVYGHFFEKSAWIRGVLFVATIPIAITANAIRVTLTGLLTQYNPELAEGFFHTAEGWVIFMVALCILIAFHQLLVRAARMTRQAN